MHQREKSNTFNFQSIMAIIFLIKYKFSALSLSIYYMMLFILIPISTVHI